MPSTYMDLDAWSSELTDTMQDHLTTALGDGLQTYATRLHEKLLRRLLVHVAPDKIHQDILAYNNDHPDERITAAQADHIVAALAPLGRIQRTSATDTAQHRKTGKTPCEGHHPRLPEHTR